MPIPIPRISHILMVEKLRDSVSRWRPFLKANIPYKNTQNCDKHVNL